VEYVVERMTLVQVFLCLIQSSAVIIIWPVFHIYLSIIWGWYGPISSLSTGDTVSSHTKNKGRHQALF
jgi:hypothetical protein